MNQANFMMTPINQKTEEILMRMEYKANYLSEIYNIIIEKTINDIKIRINYYELKINSQNLSLLTNILLNSTDQAFEFLINAFNQNNYYIKGISSNKILLGIQLYDMINGNPKQIELELKENLEDKNNLIKELFNKYTKIEKDLNEMKFNNNILKEENNKLNQDNMNLKLELEFVKNNAINSINELKMQLTNSNNMINQIQQQLNQYSNIFNQINQIQSQINSVSFKLNSQLSLDNFKSNKSNNNIKLIFRYNRKYIEEIQKEISPNVMALECKPDEKIKKVILKFCEKECLIPNICDYVKFVWNAKVINIESSDGIQSLGLSNNANIFVVVTKNIIAK